MNSKSINEQKVPFVWTPLGFDHFLILLEVHLNRIHLMCFRVNILIQTVVYLLYTADEAHGRHVVRAAGAPQPAVEERGAGMPRRRRNLASMVASRRPQREAVEPGRYRFRMFCYDVKA